MTANLCGHEWQPVDDFGAALIEPASHKCRRPADHSTGRHYCCAQLGGDDYVA